MRKFSRTLSYNYLIFRVMSMIIFILNYFIYEILVDIVMNDVWFLYVILELYGVREI